MTPKALDVRIVATSRQYAAVPMHQVMQWAAEGRLTPQDYVRAAGTTAWLKVADVPLLASQLPDLDPPDRAAMTAPTPPNRLSKKSPLSPESREEGLGVKDEPAGDLSEIDLDSLGSIAASDDWPAAPVEDTSLDMLPMIDVIFQLIIFFMFSNSLANPSPIDAPEAVYGQGVSLDGTQMIVVDEQGQLFLGDSPKPESRIASVDELVLKVAANADLLGQPMPVIVTAHKQTRHASVRQLVTALSGMSEVTEIKVGVEEKK